MRSITGYFATCPVCDRAVEVQSGKLVTHRALSWVALGSGIRCGGSGQAVPDSAVTVVRV